MTTTLPTPLTTTMNDPAYRSLLEPADKLCQDAVVVAAGIAMLFQYGALLPSEERTKVGVRLRQQASKLRTLAGEILMRIPVDPPTPD